MYTPAEDEASPQVQRNIKTQLSTERDRKTESASETRRQLEWQRRRQRAHRSKLLWQVKVPWNQLCVIAVPRFLPLARRCSFRTVPLNICSGSNLLFSYHTLCTCKRNPVLFNVAKTNQEKSIWREWISIYFSSRGRLESALFMFCEG